MKMSIAAFLILVLIYSCKKATPPFPPIGSFVGTYHVTGRWSYWQGGDTGVMPSGYVDTNITIVSGGENSLILSGNWYNYASYTIYVGAVSYDTTNNYNFAWYGNGDNSGEVIFRKPFNDSIFFNSYIGGRGSGTTTQWQGKKIL